MPWRNTKDILVVEAVNSAAMKNIDVLGAFSRVYFENDYVVSQSNLIYLAVVPRLFIVYIVRECVAV